MRILFMGTPEFAVPVLDAIAGQDSLKVIAIYTQPDRRTGRGQQMAYSAVKKRALELRLPVYQPDSLKPPEAVDEISDLRPDVIVVAAYGKILPAAVLKIPPLGCLNVHASLLPKFRGPSPITAAIIAGGKVTGVTIMLLDEGMDTGPVLAQKEIPISDEDTGGSLTGKLSQSGAGLLMETLPRWAGKEIVARPQDHSMATYTRVINKDDGRIDWKLPAEELWRRVRAFTPWPGSHTFWNSRVLKIHRALAFTEDITGRPGEVVLLNNKVRVGVRTGKGILGLVQVQIEGKKIVYAADFLNGYPDFTGAILS